MPRSFPEKSQGDQTIPPFPPTPDWPTEVHDALRHAGVQIVSYVPDAGHRRLIELCHRDSSLTTIPLTTEEEAVGLSLGAWLGGEKSVLLLQSSGVGNMVNALGILEECQLPFLMIVAMRGEEGELNPWQVPVGQATPGILQTMGVHVLRAENPGELASLVSLGLTEAFEEEAAVAALISQSLIGIKSFLEGGKPTTPPKGGRPVTAGALSVPRFAGRRPGSRPGEEDPGPARTPEGVLHRRQVVATLLEDRGDLLVVAGLGAAAWDCTAAGDHPLTFPFWGGMGLAAVAGLGLALAQPRRRILVVTGDGELLMGLGSLATVAVQRPDNLTIVVLDNGRYGETGMQETHTAHGVDLASVAAACGFRRTSTISAMEEVADLRATIHNGRGPILSVVKVIPEELPLALPPRDGTLLKARFRDALFSPRTPSHPSPPRTPGGRDAE